MTSHAQSSTPNWLNTLKEQKALLALLVLIAVVSMLSDNFFTMGNMMNILRQTSVNAILAVGMTLVILTAGIDLSVGALLALCGAFGATMVGLELPLAVTLICTLAVGALLGSINGLLIAVGKVQAFIATLVTMTAIRGMTMVYTDGRPVSTGFTDAADSFAFLGTGTLFGVPMPVWLMLLCFIGAWVLLNHTRLGRYIYAIGGNESAARLSGIRVERVKVAVYGISGMMAALAGLIVTSRLSSAQPTAGTGYELDAIAAVVVGGASLAGGRGFIWGTLVGALIIGFLNNALNLLDVSSYYQMIAKAAVILLAVIADRKSHA